MTTGQQPTHQCPNLTPDLLDPVKVAFDRLQQLDFEMDSVRIGGETYTRFRRGTCVVLARIRVASVSCTGVIFSYTGDAPPPAIRRLMQEWPNWYCASVVTSRQLELLCALNEPRTDILRRRLGRQGVVGVEDMPLAQVLLTLEQMPTLAA